jgi:hypothetical protein
MKFAGLGLDVVAVAWVVVASGVWSWVAGRSGRVVVGGSGVWVEVWYGWWYVVSTCLLFVGCSWLRVVVCDVASMVTNIVVVICIGNFVYSLVVYCCSWC